VTGFGIYSTPTGICIKVNACSVLQHDELGTRNISVFHIFQHFLFRELYTINTFFLLNILLQFISRTQELGNSVLYLSDDFMATGNIHAGHDLVNCCHNIMETEHDVVFFLNIYGTSILVDTVAIVHAVWEFKAICL
jgi:hypothetical protein